MTPEPDDERVQEEAERRSRDRAERVESTLEGTEGFFEEDKYPATSEELSVEYANQVIDLPNETEPLGSVFDRLVGERFETPAEAREAVLNELTGEASGDEEYNDQRELRELDDVEGGEDVDGNAPQDLDEADVSDGPDDNEPSDLDDRVADER